MREACGSQTCTLKQRGLRKPAPEQLAARITKELSEERIDVQDLARPAFHDEDSVFGGLEQPAITHFRRLFALSDVVEGHYGAIDPVLRRSIGADRHQVGMALLVLHFPLFRMEIVDYI